MELALNMGAFEALDYNELFAVDGGWNARQWIAAGLIVVGVALTVASVFVAPEATIAIGKATVSAAKVLTVAGAVSGGSGGLLAIG